MQAALARVATLAMFGVVGAVASSQISVTPIGTYRTGVFDQAAAEIVAFDPPSARLFFVNGNSDTVGVLDISNPLAPTLVTAIDLSAYGNPNSVAVRDGVVAVAVGSDPKTDPGKVVFLDVGGNIVKVITVGALPDMLTFSPNGRYLIVANEGEPSDDYTIDPEGSVSIIDMTGGVAGLTQDSVSTASFSPFNAAVLDPSIRIFGPGATVAQDLEPEYVTVSHDSKTAWVTCQEANAIAIVDLKTATVTSLVGLGFKSHMLPGMKLDPSDRDSGINIGNWPVYGMYQPDSIASIDYKGSTYLITANEGDTRAWSGFNEEARASTLNLDPVAFPNAAFLKNNARLGRLTVTRATGDDDNDGDFDRIFAFGARSFTVWNTSGSLVWDSGDQFEQITAASNAAFFNSDNSANNFDNRSDNKGPEPEGLVLGKAFGRTYAFIGLERIGGVMVYDVTNPTAPSFVTYVNNRDFSGDPEADTAGDLGPEGLTFIKAEDSPTGQPLLVVANEVSGSVTVYAITKS
jgi:2',3'-cyclic-nucleotide 2'-phosphodiesterase/3'-nucleotidase/5'-nucleotidase